MTIELSIVVCTYDRPQLLCEALQSLCEQSLEPSRYEIIIVDNAGSDEVARWVAQQQAASPQHAIRLIREEQVGLSYARNTGTDAAQAELVAFTDDDAKPPPNWAACAIQCFSQSSAPSCAGGPTLPFYTDEKPPWFKDDYELWRWGEVARRLEFGEAFVGSNMIWQKKVLQQLGGFPTDLGMRGKKMAMGEDTLMYQQLWANNNNAVCWYDPKLVVLHWVPPAKMMVRYRLLRHFAGGAAQGRICLQVSFSRAIGHLLWSLVVTPIHFALAWLSIFRFHHRQQWLVESWEGFLRRSGMIVGLLEVNVALRQPNES